MIHASLAPPQLLVAGEAVANAVILWLTAAWGVFMTPSPDPR